MEIPLPRTMGGTMGLREVELSLQCPLLSLEVDVPNPNRGLVFLVTSRPPPKLWMGPPTVTSSV